MKLIPLSVGYNAQVSDEDFEYVSMFSWRLSNQRGYLYAINDKFGSLHRIILGVSDPKVFVDHKDRNGLNCQRDNIRISTPQQNCCNSKVHKDSTTGYKGVYFVRKTSKYQAYITCKGNRYLLGSYITPYLAMLAYNKKAKELFGEFAGLNVPTFEDQFKCYLRGETNIMPVRVSIDKIKEIDTTCDHYFASYIVDGNACYEPCEFCGEVKHAGL